MNFYKDLTYYSDWHFENAINIGWISPNDKLETTKINNELIDKLLPYLSCRINQYRGGNYLKEVEILGEKYLLGYSEMRIISHDFQRKYAVSDIIFYAMIEQGYCPPQVFIDDLMNAIPVDSEKYQAYLKNYTLDSFWGESKEYINNMQEFKNLIVNDNQKELMKKITFNNKLLDLVTDEGSLLNVAIKYEKNSIALSLIDAKININKFNGIELLTAIKMKQNEVIDKLIENIIIYRDYSPEINPLFYAVENHNLPAIKSLLKSEYGLYQVYNNEFVRNFSILECVEKFGNYRIKDYFKTIPLKKLDWGNPKSEAI